MMWTRKELKAQAKESLQRNYWKIVLVAFLTVLFCGGTIGGHRTAATAFSNSEAETTAEGAEISAESIGTLAAGAQPDEDSGNSIIDPEKARMVGITVFFLIAIILFLFLYTLNILLVAPFRVGACRFMIKSIDDRAEVREITYGFDHSYKNVVKTMFHCDIRILLWSLLFIIPGLYKQYQYFMVPYILAEHPDMDYREALKKSTAMMDGHKWKTFILYLSFIPWYFLSLITCGAVQVFYTTPYYYLTMAALYRRLSSPEFLPSEPNEEQQVF